jgi:hypothetical protein
MVEIAGEHEGASARRALTGGLGASVTRGRTNGPGPNGRGAGEGASPSGRIRIGRLG